MFVFRQCSPAEEMNDFLCLSMKNVKKLIDLTWPGIHFLFLNGAVRRPAVKQLFTNTLPFLRVNTRVTHSYGLCSCVCVGPSTANGGPPAAASEAERSAVCSWMSAGQTDQTKLGWGGNMQRCSLVASGWTHRMAIRRGARWSNTLQHVIVFVSLSLNQGRFLLLISLGQLKRSPLLKRAMPCWVAPKQKWFKSFLTIYYSVNNSFNSFFVTSLHLDPTKGKRLQLLSDSVAFHQIINDLSVHLGSHRPKLVVCHPLCSPVKRL